MTRRAAPKKRTSALHLRIGLHPVFLLALCAIGVVLLAVTFKVFANQTYNVRATVQADPVTIPAVITRPNDEYRTSSPEIDVMGTCPTFSYVKLYIDDSFHGTAVCDVSGQFLITTTLTPGRNVIMAQVFNLTDQPGPTGSNVTVFYDQEVTSSPAVVVAQAGDTPKTSEQSETTLFNEPVSVAPVGTELEFMCECNYQARYVDDAIEIPVTLKGGTSPYDLYVNWGDGTNDSYVDQVGPAIVVSHRYKEFSAGLKAFTIKVDVVDAVGVKATYQIYQLVRNTAFQPAVVGPALPVKNAPWLALLPAFAIVVLLIFVFWLGERHELEMAQAKSKRPSRPRRPRHS